MDFDFSSFFVGLIVGLGIAYLVIHQLGKMIYRRLEAAVEEQVEAKTDSDRIQMKVEKHGDVIYAFRLDNDDFVCQGADLAELKRNFVARFPGKNGAIVEIPDEMLRKTILAQKEELAKTTWPKCQIML